MMDQNKEKKKEQTFGPRRLSRRLVKRMKRKEKKKGGWRSEGEKKRTDNYL